MSNVIAGSLLLSLGKSILFIISTIVIENITKKVIKDMFNELNLLLKITMIGVITTEPILIRISWALKKVY